MDGAAWGLGPPGAGPESLICMTWGLGQAFGAVRVSEVLVSNQHHTWRPGPTSWPFTELRAPG